MTAPAQRIHVRVVARRLTGAPESWVPVDTFSADAGECMARIADEAVSLSTKHAGDVLGFRLSARVGGAGVVYWYVPNEGPPVRVPAADPTWGDKDVTRHARGRDWLSAWTESTHPGRMLEALGRVSEPVASAALEAMVNRVVDAFDALARAKAIDTSTLDDARGRMRADFAVGVPASALRDFAAMAVRLHAALTEGRFEMTPQAMRIVRRVESTLAADQPLADAAWQAVSAAGVTGVPLVVSPAAFERARREVSDGLRGDVPLRVLLPLLECEVRCPQATIARIIRDTPPYEPA